MVVPLPPGTSPLFTDSRTELTWSPQLSLITSRHGPHKKHLLLLRSCLLLRERDYRADTQKRPWYIRPSRRRCIATALHATVYLCCIHFGGVCGSDVTRFGTALPTFRRNTLPPSSW
jgi:hypothetical protein